MGGSKRQHFIPRSYLRNFSTVQGDKQFVEVMDKETGQIDYPRSTKDICVAKNIYTIPKAQHDGKYALENYYAENVDSIYPEVYALLADESVIQITEDEREKILSTCLSLYFRTPKFLDADDAELDAIIQRMRSFKVSPTADLFFSFKGRKFTFKQSQIDVVFQEARELNKLDFIINHFAEWQAFLKHKKNSGIMVISVTDEVPLITSDNPVDIYRPFVDKIDVFDPLNVINIPLDRKHYLWISPEEKDADRLKIVRSKRDKAYALTLNSTTEKNAMDWLIGEKGTLQIHREQLDKHNENTPENEKMWADAKAVALGMNDLYNYIMENGGPGSEATRRKFNEYRAIPAFQNDPGFQQLAALVDQYFET
jgi:Protein of unknown function (DUF4238)